MADNLKQKQKKTKKTTQWMHGTTVLCHSGLHG